MSPRFSLADDVPPLWRYGLVGGLFSLPLTVGAYRWSGAGGHMSLSFVGVAGLVAGYLVAGWVDDVGRVGFRAGLVGALPVLWISYRGLDAVIASADSPWFLAFGVGAAVVITALSFFLSAVVGYLAAKVGGWLAGKAGGGDDPSAVADPRETIR